MNTIRSENYTLNREIIVNILKVTKAGPVDYSLVAKNSGIPVETVKKFLIVHEHVEKPCFNLRERILSASPSQRVQMAIQSIRWGADPERICQFLEWKEFETFTQKVFEAFQYRVNANFRFKGNEGKRWEIDLVAYKKPLIISVDCKHWRYGWTESSIRKVAEEHVNRTLAFTKTLSNHIRRISLDNWNQAQVVPVILSLLSSSCRFHLKTPIVPVLSLRSFLNDLPLHEDYITQFNQKIGFNSKKLEEFL